MFETSTTYTREAEIENQGFTTHIFETLYAGRQAITWPTHRELRVIECQQCGELIGAETDDRHAYSRHMNNEHKDD